MNLETLSDPALESALRSLVADNRKLTARVLAHLSEVDTRRLYLNRACSSMHTYCTRELKFDDGAACKRIHAARAARRFPVLLDMVADGRLHLSGITLLAPKLTPGNATGLLTAAAGKGKRDIERIVAARFPRADTPTSIRRMSAPKVVPTRQPELSPATVVSPRPGPRPTPRPQPVAADRFKVQLTVGSAFVDKLERAKALMRYVALSSSGMGCGARSRMTGGIDVTRRRCWSCITSRRSGRAVSMPSRT